MANVAAIPSEAAPQIDQELLDQEVRQAPWRVLSRFASGTSACATATRLALSPPSSSSAVSRRVRCLATPSSPASATPSGSAFSSSPRFTAPSRAPAPSFPPRSPARGARALSLPGRGTPSGRKAPWETSKNHRLARTRGDREADRGGHRPRRASRQGARRRRRAHQGAREATCRCCSATRSTRWRGSGRRRRSRRSSPSSHPHDADVRRAAASAVVSVGDEVVPLDSRAHAARRPDERRALDAILAELGGKDAFQRS